jgi:DHA1 family multidrug resistance protein-like MFS transporter
LKGDSGLLGTVVGVGALGSLLFAVPGGWLADQWGYRPLMLRSALLCAASVLLVAFFPSITGLMVGLFFLEIGRQLFVLAAQSLVAGLGPERDLNLDFGWLNTAFAVSQFVGPLAGGILADTAGYFPAWLAIAGLLAAAAAGIPRLIPPTPRVRPAADAQATRKSWRYYLARRRS